MTIEAAIEARDLSVGFAKPKHVKVFSNLHFSVPRGSFVSIVGPSGCGKSTLLKTIAGFIAPGSGSLKSFGEPISGPSPDRAILFQSDTGFPWMTAAENIAFAARCRGLSHEQALAESHAWIGKIGLSGFEDFYPAQLSGGMGQRVALTRTFASAAEILLLDEPFRTLDRSTRNSIWDALLSLWSERKCTILFVTHDIDEAIYLSDSVIVMNGRPGHIIDIVPVSNPRPRSFSWLLTKTGIDLRERIYSLHG